jgi:uncharacterized membrane protein
MSQQENKRQDKKDQFVEKKSSSVGKLIGLVAVLIGLVAVLIVAAVAGWFFLGQGVSDGIASVKSENGMVMLKVSDIDDGKAHYFKFATPKGPISFFVVKSVDGVMRAAFDACDVCYREMKGYRQEGDSMVCNNCDMRFRTDLINEVKGGCNPAPLARRVDGDKLAISEADILKGGWYFGI